MTSVNFVQGIKERISPIEKQDYDQNISCSDIPVFHKHVFTLRKRQQIKSYV